MSIKNIIKETIRLREEFDWIQDIEADTDLEIGQLWLRSGGIDSNNSKFFAKEIERSFHDIELKGDRIYLIVGGYEDLIDLFSDSDNAQYGYVNKWLADQIFGEDDYWEPYTNVVYDWEEQVWDVIKDNDGLYNYITNYIKEGDFIGEPLSTSDELEDPEGEGFREDMLLDKGLMGELIQHDDLFHDLKLELTWAYESAYNVAARDEIWNSANGAIEGEIGESKWTSREIVNRYGRKILKHLLIFDVTSTIFEYVDDYFRKCFEDDCGRYYKSYGEDEGMSLEEYCEDCWEFEESSFLDFLVERLKETDSELNPRFSEWPDSSKVVEYFIEDVYNRI